MRQRFKLSKKTLRDALNPSFYLPDAPHSRMVGSTLKRKRSIKQKYRNSLELRYFSFSMYPLTFLSESLLRRERDSNPRYAFGVYTLSRRASSATRAPLQYRAVLPCLLLRCRALVRPQGSYRRCKVSLFLANPPLLAQLFYLRSLSGGVDTIGFLRLRIRAKNLTDSSGMFPVGNIWLLSVLFFGLV